MNYRAHVVAVAAALSIGSAVLLAEDKPDAPAGGPAKEKVEYLAPERSAATKGAETGELVALPLQLPRATVIGTPKEPPPNTTVDLKTLGKRRGPFLVPKGVSVISKGKKATVSDEAPIMGDANLVTDGSKEAGGGEVCEMSPGLQYGQVDLAKSAEIVAIVVWHNHFDSVVYRDVVVQVSDDATFKTGVTTLFNNDQDNSAGLGAGSDREYFESAEGKLVDGRGIKARYVRCYTKGNTSDAQNHLIEIEVWGK
ncbi:MAG TPA: hypothetical protein VEA69_16970 [Tepidisphaeraceae bacterium]|nr:hypothetical protein [Tepidisphaeraceae bacterium]